ncbi:MAG: hypothetical protein BMS9Abin34_019 [Patescibacteria group bacterium]|nr:MAG: hypothetical protein BMS9Abin34_019 [Patescibacteria group bacterium]
MCKLTFNRRLVWALDLEMVEPTRLPFEQISQILGIFRLIIFQPLPKHVLLLYHGSELPTTSSGLLCIFLRRK